MSFRDLIQAFVTVFPAELPDKTMVASIILVTRYRRPLWVWVGAVAAFTVHVVVAVAAGTAIGLLPETVVQSVVAVLFLVGAGLLLREARKGTEEVVDVEAAPRSTVRATLVASFGFIVLAEWGDLTQLATASLAAKSGEPISTGVGAWLALAAVAAIAAAFGRQIVARVALHKINYLGAAVFGSLAVWTIAELVAGL